MLTLRRGLAASRAFRRFSTKPHLIPPANLTEGEKLIYDKLTDKFLPSELDVQDISGGCGDFYAIKIASEAFKGLSTLNQHRLVTRVLKQEIEGIHGLQVKTISSESES
ncbi:bola-like protein [Suillus fuscotomentosus]|uniref:Bola-like protein n=1 Tax=Suillus fuscotomentosus TaxID=1912939 RepID=A0AAD4EDJ4_9AGAM|nr:bola-like protein [Suillus fuscotomentosus]KAG1902973.1 bola-like protein [Suillus fuscotomentosus]